MSLSYNSDRKSKKQKMFPLDERVIDDEAVVMVMNLALQYAFLEETEDFYQDMKIYFETWEGYICVRNGLERYFLQNRNLEKVIYKEASRIYIDYSYNMAISRYCARIGG